MDYKIDQIKFHDLKIEVLIAELLEFYENEMLPVNFSLQGQFERSYSKDILKKGTKFDVVGDEYDQIELSREGIYDGLPTFLMHSITKKQKRGQDLKDNATISDEINEEEEHARNFFNPFEQEIYRYRGKILKDEMEFKVSLDVFKDYFLELIEDGSEFSLNVLLTLLPMIHNLRGDMGKFERLIKKLLKTDITIVEKHLNNVTLLQNDEVPLGELTLGQNAVVDTTSKDFMIGYSIDIKKGGMSYDESEKMKRMVGFLADLSISADLTYDVNISVYDSMFVLSDNPENCPILAYNTII